MSKLFLSCAFSHGVCQSYDPLRSTQRPSHTDSTNPTHGNYTILFTHSLLPSPISSASVAQSVMSPSGVTIDTGVTFDNQSYHQNALQLSCEIIQKDRPPGEGVGGAVGGVGGVGGLGGVGEISMSGTDSSAGGAESRRINMRDFSKGSLRNITSSAVRPSG